MSELNKATEAHRSLEVRCASLEQELHAKIEECVRLRRQPPLPRMHFSDDVSQLHQLLYQRDSMVQELEAAFAAQTRGSQAMIAALEKQNARMNSELAQLKVLMSARQKEVELTCVIIGLEGFVLLFRGEVVLQLIEI